MWENISLTVTLVGTFLAGVYDLKTTEVPDSIPHAMAGIGLALALLQSFFSNSFEPILNSLIAGSLLTAFGGLMYFFGQWGGADALILGAVGFLLPQVKGANLLFPFPFSYLLNVFLIGAAYMLTYALVFTLVNKKVAFSFLAEIKASMWILLVSSLGLFFLAYGINFYIFSIYKLPIEHTTIAANSLLILTITIGVYALLKFAKVVEEVGFKKRIPTSKLKVGDVLVEQKFWRGLTKNELKKIRASGKKFVWIKEGVRFAPTFFLALIFTLYWGDGISLILRLFMG